MSLFHINPPRGLHALASAARCRADGERYFGQAGARVRALLPRLRGRLRAGNLELERRLGLGSVDSELATCTFFLFLITLTFLL